MYYCRNEPQNYKKTYSCCDAPWPANLTYKDDQIKCFGKPEVHEFNWRRNIRRTDLNASLNGDAIVDDDIPDNYLVHLQDWLEIIHANCLANECFEEICDVAYMKVDMDRNYISLTIVDIRPCAQGLGLIKLILCQLIKTCHILNKNLIIFEPVSDTTGILNYLFGNNNIDTLKTFIIQNEINTTDLDYRKIEPDYFSCKLGSEQLALNELVLKNIYLIESSEIHSWNQECDISLAERCKVTAMIKEPFFNRNVVVINHAYFPPASDLNDQDKVDTRYNNALRRRESKLVPERPPPRSFIIDPHAQIGEDVSLGDDCAINKKVQIHGKTLIGNGTSIDENTLIKADCSIGDRCKISIQCTIGERTRVDGGCTIGRFVKIGKQCTVENSSNLCDGVSVGGESSVGGGANIHIGAKIGKGCTLGENTAIGLDTIIGDGSTVGHDGCISYCARIGCGVAIGATCTIGNRCIIYDGVKIGSCVFFDKNVNIHRNCTIGRNCVINKNVYIDADAEIGMGCTIGEGCDIGSGVKIGDYVQLGDGVTILSGCTVMGENCIIHNGVRINKKDMPIGKNCIIDQGCAILTGSQIADRAHITKKSKYSQFLEEPRNSSYT